MIIGLTGGIGSGKTTAENIFNSLGIESVDADTVARNIREKPNIESAIINHFGEAITLPNDTLNKQALRYLIFKNDKAKIWLENLLHPLIRKEIEVQLQKIKSAYGLLVSPLLFEAAQDKLVHRTLVIENSREQQINRTINRDNITRNDAIAIMNKQMSTEQRRQKADDIITNGSSIEELRENIKRIHEFYCQLLIRNTSTLN